MHGTTIGWKGQKVYSKFVNSGDRLLWEAETVIGSRIGGPMTGGGDIGIYRVQRKNLPLKRLSSKRTDYISCFGQT